MHAYRTHTCGALRLADAGRTVRLSGWVHRKRDHGQLLFVDLRDHYGITQCVIDVSSPLFPAAEALRLESVVTMTGHVAARTEDTVNPNLPTGEVELVIDALDLRREDIHAKMMLRSAVIASIRRHMIEQGFTEFQTPILTADSPEGARPYLVPSRLHPGEFYALPHALGEIDIVQTDVTGLPGVLKTATEAALLVEIEHAKKWASRRSSPTRRPIETRSGCCWLTNRSALARRRVTAVTSTSPTSSARPSSGASGRGPQVASMIRKWSNLSAESVF